jgi:zinc/manganese transport system substrate-binding protein
MKKLCLLVSSLVLSSLAYSASADLKVVACEPEWGALTQELGGDKVEVFNATTALQDPHHIQARPSLIAKVRNADLVICTGAELEVGWLPILLRQAGNAKVQPGNPGYLEATQYVQLLEVPTVLSRGEGDVHAAGNPHIQTDPHNIALVGNALAQRLAELDPPAAAYYQQRHDDFSARWQQAMHRWEAQAAPLKGLPIVVHHKGWVYLNRWLGLREVAALEPKPGVSPSVAYLAEILSTLQKQPAKVIIRTPYDDPRPSEYLTEQIKIPNIVLPGTVGGDAQAEDLFGLFEDTIHRLLEATR